MYTLLKDFRYALRVFRESPGFTITAIAAITLGIAANTAIFSAVNTLIFKPIPFPEPDTLVQLMNSNNGNPAGSGASPAKYMHWRSQTDVFEDVVAYRGNSFNYSAGDLPERVNATQASDAYFRVLRTPMEMGRGFNAQEDLPGAPKTVVISHAFWTQRLGGDPDVLGKSLSLSGENYTIIGVISDQWDVREFGNPEIWVPFQFDPNTTDQGHYFQALGRLRESVSLEQAQARLEASAAGYRDRFPNALGENAGFTAVSLQQALIGQGVRRAVYILSGAVAFVLLIACANVANLLLVRANARSREIAIRSALGAKRFRIIRQLLTESVMLSLVGGVLGLFIGYLGMRSLLATTTAQLPRLGSGGALMGMDWRVVTFALVLAVVTGILFGLVPALVTSRTDLNTVIKDSSSRSGSGFRQNKTRSILVITEVALAVILLVGASLLIRSSLEINRVDPGFATENVLTMRTSLSGPDYQTSTAVELAARRTLDRIETVPGVEAATMTCCVPLQGGYGLPFNIIGRDNEGPYTGGTGVVMSSGSFFDTFSIPVLQGRAFTERDDEAAPPVLIINEAFANEYWDEGTSPVGERVLLGGGTGNMGELDEEPIREIVGVVGNARAQGLRNEPGPISYIPQAQMPDALNALNVNSRPFAWVVRTRDDPLNVSAAIQNEIRQTTGLPLTDIRTMEEIVSISTERERVFTLLMTVFGAGALLLAAIGIYGLMAYSVQQRNQEIGIRMALGAKDEVVRAMVIKQGMLLVLIGIAVGLVGAWFVSNLLAFFLYEVDPQDITTFIGVPLILVLISIAAISIPAIRASRIDPLEALRYE